VPTRARQHILFEMQNNLVYFSAMDNIIILPLIKIMQNLPVEITSFILFGVCITAMLLLFRLFGKHGLYIYNIVAVLAANIQVLKGMQLSFSNGPVALGTVVFSTTYLCSGILTEHYSKEAAKQGIWFCFAAQILMTILMIMAIGHQPLPVHAIVSGTEHMLLAEQAISLLFTPSPRLLLSSLLAFTIAQFTGVWIFQILSNFTHKKYLWLRTIILTTGSTTIDAFIFNFLAWSILSPQPASFSVILYTYILWALITQGFITILSTPMIYLSYRCRPINAIYTHEQP